MKQRNLNIQFFFGGGEKQGPAVRKTIEKIRGLLPRRTPTNHWERRENTRTTKEFFGARNSTPPKTEK